MLLSRTLRTLPGQVAGPLAQMAAAVVFTHFLDPVALGVYALAWAAQELVYYGAVAWWTSFVQRSAASFTTPEDRARFNAAETAVQLGSALLQALVAALAISLVLEMPWLGFIAALVAFTLTRNAATHFAARARAEDSDLAFTILQSAGPLGGLALGIAALSFIAPTAEVLLAAYALAQGISLLIGLPLMRFAPTTPRLDRAMLRASFSYGAPLIIANLLEWAANHGVRLIVEIGEGTAGVGLVTTAWWLGLRIAAFVALLVTGATFAAAIRALDTEGPASARRQLADNGALMLALLAPAVAGGALLAPAFATIAVAEPFREATALLLPFALAAGALKAFREHGPEQALLVFRFTRAAAMTALVEAVMTLTLGTLGLIFYGLLGAVAGAALASLVGAIFSQVLANRRTGYVIRLADLARITAATALMAAAVYALPARSDLTGLIMAVAVGAAVYGAVSLVLWRGALRAAMARTSPASSDAVSTTS